MLANVHVKNLALIEETEIELGNGFNILTGETGAGKSIIIGSINYCLGAKADKDVIREGAEYALVELTFCDLSEKVLNVAKDMDIPTDDGDVLILTRRIMPGRSVFKINGETVTAKQMRELAAFLIDIHGQHDHQSLLQERKQKEMLDGFAGDELGGLLVKLSSGYDAIKEIDREIDSFETDEGKRAREISLAEYEVNEIENAALKPGEEDELLKRHNLMANGMKIKESLVKAEQYLGGDNGALALIGYALKEMSMAPHVDDETDAMTGHIGDAEQVVLDAHREICSYMDKLDFDDSEFAEVEERLDLIGRLSLKYGKTTADIIDYGEKKKEELERLTGGLEYLNSLKAKREKLLAEYKKNAGKAHDIRVKEAKRLSGDITASLKDLNFLKVDFKIEVTAADDENHYARDGYDDICFMISLNAGEKLRPLSDVASGGELSRVMLALKTVLAARDNIDTLIFDEIDSGISGVTAWQVALKIGELSKAHQIICITHLPQIAAMSDHHFVITKHEKDGRTVTELNRASGVAHIDEIARLLGSENITDAVRLNAIDLLKQAHKYEG